MLRALSNDLRAHLDERVRVSGWLHHSRLLGKLGFLVLRDRGGLMQIVVRDPSALEGLRPLQPGSVLTATGVPQINSQCQLGVEITAQEVTVDVAVTEPPPLEYWLHQIPVHLDTLLDDRAIALRNESSIAVFRIQDQIAKSFSAFMRDEVGAVEYFGPNLIGSASEGGADTFRVEYFDRHVSLAQSGQLYKQMLVGVFERVFSIAPFFRAEPSHTSRHLSEGRQLEIEIGFLDDWTELMDLQERLIKTLIRDLRINSANSLANLRCSLPLAPPEISFPRLTMLAAQQIAFERTGVDDREEGDLSPQAERELCRYANERFGTDFLFVTHWPRHKRPFYAHPNQENPELTNTFDLIGAGSELSSGGQRRHLYSSVVAGMREKGLNCDDFPDYLSAFRYGLPPHGGIGMGLERLTMNFLGLKNIREASLFPSDPRRIASRSLFAKTFRAET